MRKYKLFALSLCALTLCACGPKNPTPASEPEVDNTVSVFVLSGQSNMEGQSLWDNGGKWLQKAFTTLGIDGDICFEGIPEVKTSYFGTGYGELNDPKQIHASNPTEKIKGAFLNTKVGMGHADKYIGPELGCAYKLREHASEDKPIYFIKCAFSGSGFQQGNDISWALNEGKAHTLYDDYFKPFVSNNLALIEEETGLKPVIKGFLWHQGESDCDNAKIPLYRDRMDTLLSTFKEDFKDYAKDNDGSNIAFIDALIYDGKNYSWSNVDRLNQVKLAYAEESEKNFCINTSTKLEGGMKLEVPGYGAKDTGGGDAGVHYKTVDCFRLGMAYADIIIENNLLD